MWPLCGQARFGQRTLYTPHQNAGKESRIRRMEQVESELERFEERPEFDNHRRYGLLLKRLEELEKLYYKLRHKQAPGPYQLIERILAEP
jgi:hypothetical protein